MAHLTKKQDIDPQAAELLSQIEILRQLFPDGGKKKNEFDSDGTNGILYLSRFSSNTSQSDTGETEKKKKVNKNLVQDNSSNENEQKDSPAKSVSINSQSREKKRQYAISLVTLASKPENRIKMYEDGCMAILIELASQDDPQIHRSCAACFSYLAGEPKIRNKMIDDGCIYAIFTLSSSHSTTVQSDCARAICNLCNSIGGEARAVRDGATIIVSHIATINPDVFDICVTTLLNLSCVADKYTKIEDINDAIILMNTLPLNEELDELILAALCNLSSLRGNQLRLVEDGCIKIIERLIISNNPNIRALASEVTCNLTSDPRSRSKILENNMLKILMNMSKDNSEFVRTCCIQCYYNLSRDLQSREKMVASQSVPIIIKISMEKVSTSMAKIGAKTLRSLCSDISIANYLVKEGIMRAFTSLIEVEDIDTRQLVAEALCTLFNCEKILNKLIEQGAVGLVVSLSHSQDNQVTGEWCAFALYHLSSSGLCPISTLVNGVLPCLIKLCDSSNFRSKQFCASAFSHITKQKSVDSSCAIPMLVHMLRHETEHFTKAECASALYNLADSDSCCNMMLSAGALMPIVHLTQSEFMLTKIKCAAILSRLSLHSQYYSQFARDDVLNVLLELASVDHTLTQRRVVIAISNLSQSLDLRKMLLNLKTTPHRIKTLISKPDENLRRGCSAIICNLSYETGSGREMMDADILPSILVTALVASDQIETKLICVKALINLMADNELHKEMVKKDVIWGLSNLAQTDNVEILSLCSKSLCRLSVKFAKDMLHAGSIIKLVVKLIKSDDFELLKLGGLILTNLLMESTEQNEAFRRIAVENMEKLVEYGKKSDEEVSEMCVLCLYFASQSESCRSVIVSAGLLQHLDASKIFAEPRVSYAYLAMFENIANNPGMRSKLLDDHLVERFSQVCKSNDQELNLAVAKALYCISCDDSNIIKLLNQNVLPIFLTLWYTEKSNPSDKIILLMHHLVAGLYNLCTNELVYGKLVSQGIVKVFLELWSEAEKDPKYAYLIYLSICQLSCGNVNTVKMVEDGCIEIMAYIINPRPGFKLHEDLIDRIAASLRNLLCIFASHDILVDGGCIETLVMIAKMVGQPRAKEDASAALRSLTYNLNLRDKLVSTGAIDIMLDDITRSMKGELPSMNKNLLSSLESESWGNGSRGAIKEGRSQFYQPLSLYLDLLRGASHIKVDFDTKSAPLEKYLVQIQLLEPPIEVEALASKSKYDINGLSTYQIGPDDFDLHPMSKPKRDCPILDHSVLDLKRGIVENKYNDEDSAEDSPRERERSNSGEIVYNLPDINIPKHIKIDPHNMPYTNDNEKNSKSLTSLPSLKTKKTKKIKKPEPKDKFDEIVSIINRSKRSNGALIQEVSEKWSEFSRF